MSRASGFARRRVTALAAAVLLSVSLSNSLYGQYELPDTLRFDPVIIYYPGQPDTGRIKAELRWFTGSGGLASMSLSIDWSGAVACDSFVANPALEQVLDTIIVTINNDATHIGVSHSDVYSPYVDFPADYKYGDFYFTVTDTAVVQFTSPGPEFYADPIPVWFWGYWNASSWFISNPGDVSNDGIAGNVTDIVYLIDYIFGSEPPQPTPFADINGDCIINITDVVCLINYIFSSGLKPAPGCPF